MTELRECPFCGGEVEIDSQEHQSKQRIIHIVQIWCDTCDIGMSRSSRETCEVAQKDATLAWNRRADDWQPIATAPRDGTLILAAPPNGSVTPVWWDDGCWVLPGGGEVSQFYFTAWRPLPKGPGE